VLTGTFSDAGKLTLAALLLQVCASLQGRSARLGGWGIPDEKQSEMPFLK